jgi:hypothetical protein
MKVIIAGCRHFTNYDVVKKSLDSILSGSKVPEIVSGHCRGIDRMGEIYAIRRGWPVKLFHANWALHGRAAGPIRNREMAMYADSAIVFSSGGKGSKSMIGLAKKYNLRLTVVDLAEL